jgi:NAD(P)H-dependent FMN reductase
LIATLEHNGGYTALLKNALDWMSRPNGFPSGKVAALISAPPGLLGGVKSQLSLQIVLNKLGVHVIPESFALGAAHQCFDAEGGLKDANVEGARPRRSTRGDGHQNWNMRPRQPRRVGP